MMTTTAVDKFVSENIVTASDAAGSIVNTLIASIKNVVDTYGQAAMDTLHTIILIDNAWALIFGWSIFMILVYFSITTFKGIMKYSRPPETDSESYRFISPSDRETNTAVLFGCFAIFALLAVIIVSVSSINKIFDIWTYVALVDQDLWLAHEVAAKILKIAR